MSELRLFGLVVGGSLLLLVLYYFRRERWSRGAFVLGAITGSAVLLVSAFPDTTDFFRDLFSLDDFQYGRLLALLILSNLAALFLIIYVKAKTDKLKDLIDRSLRFAAIETVMPKDQVAARVKSVMVIIPALNEAENLEVLLPRIPKEVCGQQLGVLVVDDGSTDETKEVALRHGCLVARTPINRGQGAASRVGYSFLAREKVSIGVTMDADNQHNPDEIVTLVEPIVTGKLDLVIGSRILGSADQTTTTRRLGVSIFSKVLSLVIDHRITDSTSGFKAFRIDKMARLDLREDQFQSSEVLISAAKKGLRIGEVPIRINRRGFGESRKGTDLIYATLWLRTLAKSWWR
jgi:Glycosyl transferase family 2